MSASAASQYKPIGLLGGTFDPIHLAHLRVALEVAEALDIADMRLLPNPLPAHRDKPLLEPEQRLAMLNAAVAACSRLSLELSEWQAFQAGQIAAGYSVDTLIRLREQYPDNSLVFVVGDDAFAAIDSWRDYQQLLDLCHLVVAARPQAVIPPDSVAARWLDDFKPDSKNSIHQKKAGTVQRVPVTALDISATQIRQLLAAGRTVRYLVPDGIVDILENKT